MTAAPPRARLLPASADSIKIAAGILGAGGIKDTPELQAFYKRLKKVTGVDGDYWGNPVYYSMLQVITQAIEGVGSMDRKAIAQYIKDHKFQTLIGEIDVRNQKLNWLWTVGQWQDGVFNGVAGVNVKGGKAVRLKKGW